MNMKTILITGIGGDIAQSIATIIREERPNIRLIGTDINLEHAGSIFVDEVLPLDAYTYRVRYISPCNAINAQKDNFRVFVYSNQLPNNQ